MKLVILESPFANPDPVERLKNIAYARLCVRHSLSLGEAPIASHLLYTQPTILDDDIPDERNWGIDAGLAWSKVAEKSVFYLDRGVSRGMGYGLANAIACNRPHENRYLPGYDADKLLYGASFR